MAQDQYQDYLRYNKLGLRKEAGKSVLCFLETISSFSEKEKWTRENLLTCPKNGAGRIRHEIYEGVVLPVLLKGYQSNDPEYIYLLAMSYQNLIACRDVHQRLVYVPKLELLKKAHSLAPDEQRYEKALLDELMEALWFCDHEWPAGLLGDNYPFAALWNDIAMARELDKTDIYADRLNELSDRLEQYSKQQETLTRDQLQS
ncbi:hypothetical protein [Halocynthiibacter styelae]|uniref:Uncharacterized protein n=1 Tax=Halocynthiibacter styelae TaxID=2761955 RepID=A0A8J7IYA6_9RHOB|nr:hypothetical protein [Paenihalocynthiibacter styelae]MBI1494434.1 hypothetical protein [Paenihalocynthiibacter styelae]